MGEQDNDIVVFRYFDTAIEANIAKTKLDAYGIPCFLTEENMAGLYPGQSFNAFKIRLHLFASDRQRAHQILNADDQHVLEEDILVCPICHSTQITREFPRRLVDTLPYVLFGVFLSHKKVNQCLNCGAEF